MRLFQIRIVGLGITVISKFEITLVRVRLDLSILSAGLNSNLHLQFSQELLIWLLESTKEVSPMFDRIFDNFISYYAW